VTFANVHLSHGQWLNRWQLLHIANALEGPAAIVGDYNAVGPIKLPGFKDIGPRQPTHSPTDVISLQLDRCMGRGLCCSRARVLARGPSDHHPIVLDLHLMRAMESPNGEQVRRVLTRAKFRKWLHDVAETPNSIQVHKVIRDVIDLKLRKGKVAEAAPAVPMKFQCPLD
jgi:hypothetical protein